jgi:3-dehydroquinate synthase
VVFSRDLLTIENATLADALRLGGEARPSLFVLDSGVVDAHGDIKGRIEAYMRHHGLPLAGDSLVVPGGERCKNDHRWLDALLKEIEVRGVCRHSTVVAIGGGAVLDMAGYGAAIAHRGVRHIRVPTTTLAQGDSAVGVKNGVNAFGKKNFLGAFSPPTAVLCDATFLTTLDDRDWRSGVSEAIKVALLKDAEFFAWIERHGDALAARDLDPMETLVKRSAELHAQHIASSGDPFELGSSRPLDFGHWAAHRLESMSGYEIRHGEAVAIGLALDLTYSKLCGLLDGDDWERGMRSLEGAGFAVYSPLMMNVRDEVAPDLLRGLEEFREHLGGELTIMLLERIGRGVEVHAMDASIIREAVVALRERAMAENVSS